MSPTESISAVRLWPTYPDPPSAMCAKRTANMSHQQWAGLGVAQHRLHQGLPGSPGRAGLGSLPKPRSLPSGLCADDPGSRSARSSRVR